MPELCAIRGAELSSKTQQEWPQFPKVTTTSSRGVGQYLSHMAGGALGAADPWARSSSGLLCSVLALGNGEQQT